MQYGYHVMCPYFIHIIKLFILMQYRHQYNPIYRIHHHNNNGTPSFTMTSTLVYVTVRRLGSRHLKTAPFSFPFFLLFFQPIDDYVVVLCCVLELLQCSNRCVCALRPCAAGHLSPQPAPQITIQPAARPALHIPWNM